MSSNNDKSLMVRLNPTDKDYLQQLAREKKSSMTKVIEDLLAEHRRRSFFEGLQADYSALKQSSGALKEEQAEHDLWDLASSDGLEDE